MSDGTVRGCAIHYPFTYPPLRGPSLVHHLPSFAIFQDADDFRLPLRSKECKEQVHKESTTEILAAYGLETPHLE